MKNKIENILPLVSKPSRYIGSEVNSCVKDPAKAALRVALCFPDVYEVGISHLGLKVLYEALNRRDDIYAERAYSPWPDMEALLKERNLPLFTLETFSPLSDMDIVGFTLQYELSYTNILNMLALSGIPMRSAARGPDDPLVIAGGPCAFNPEPLAEFVDAFVIGDAEEAVVEIADAVIEHKKAQGSRAELLKRLSRIEGVYVPSHFEVTKSADGKIAAIKNVAGGPDRVKKRTVADLDAAPFPERPILPYIAAVHNRVTLEVSRGCPRGCRFCQAGYIYRPVRERSAERLLSIAEESVCSTGYEELSLSSLSAGDYSGLLPLMRELMARYEERRVSVSLPSLRVGTLTPEICREIKRVRKTGFTIAPEAGTQRLRDVINKNVTEEGLVETAETVFREGWDLIKLYFMVGLPTETDGDLDGIVSLCRKALAAGKGAPGRRKGVNVGVSVFVPKPHTPFQWMGQIPLSEMRRRKDLLKRALGKKPFAMKTGLAEMSLLEAAFARGGREAGAALYNAWEAGARFDGWTEHFDYGLWKEAFEKAGLDAEAEAGRTYALDEVLPWDHIDSGVSKKFLQRELQNALSGKLTPDCRTKCTGCGLKCRTEGEADTAAPAGALSSSGRRIDSATPRVADPRMTTPRPGQSPSARVRIRYSKLMPLALLSHSELMTVFFRAIARAGLPIMFSAGFNPHPKVSFGPALAVGIESEAETLDMELTYTIDLTEVVKKLNRALPLGLRILEARVLGGKDPAAGVGTTKFTYEAAAPEGMSGLERLVRDFLARESVPVTRTSDKGERGVNIRPMVAELAAVSGNVVKFTLADTDKGSAKPFELVQALLGLTAQEARAVHIKRIAMG